MLRTQRNRRNPRVLSPALAVVLAFAAAVPASAQTGRYAVLVPAFRPVDGGKENFGKDVAKEVNKLLEQYPTHTTVDSKVLKDALRKYGLKEDALAERDCIPGIQLAIQIDIQLVMCGTYSGATAPYTIESKITAAAQQNTFEMKPFQASEPKEAAQRIMQEFQGFLDGLKLETFCAEYTGNQDWPSAITNCRNALDINPNSRTAAYNLGSAMRATGDVEGARTMFKKVLETDPLNQDALLSLGVLEAQANNIDVAMGYFREYLNLDPNNVDVRITVATQAAQEGGNEAALRIIEDGLGNATGENKTKLEEYAGAFAMNAALKQMEASGDMSQVGNAKSIVEKGLQYLGDVYKAKGEATDVTAMRNMLTGYRLLERTDEAITFGATAVKHYPDDAALWSTYADALNKAGKMPEALAALDQIERIRSELPAALCAARQLAHRGRQPHRWRGRDPEGTAEGRDQCPECRRPRPEDRRHRFPQGDRRPAFAPRRRTTTPLTRSRISRQPRACSPSSAATPRTRPRSSVKSRRPLKPLAQRYPCSSARTS